MINRCFVVTKAILVKNELLVFVESFQLTTTLVIKTIVSTISEHMLNELNISSTFYCSKYQIGF